MNKKFLLSSIIFFAALMQFNSCSSSGSMAIPGENQVIENNIVAEYMNIAKAYDDLKNYGKAVEYYKLANQADKNNVLGNSAIYSMARSYAMAKDWMNAMELYKFLLEKDKDNTNLKISIAYLNAMSGNLEESCSEYMELCNENPTDKNLLKNYISVLIALDRMEEAEVQFKKMAETFPGEDIIKEVEKIIKESKNPENESTDTEQE